ncbi:MAG TPA: DNA starvation/stationary phase protection protein [Actinophytocola sp.]|uniref:Dps family protein n=1 Tax=Actinophytocola sp. TaxID=1872138 RepID=UPI002DB6A3A5|nr:DNA starvation/stationary phase protection protein [Actinophytocola sp.]HEU5474868.1 DNA starvation/stationary phase protection protein [Actinophytocola sp.]
MTNFRIAGPLDEADRKTAGTVLQATLIDLINLTLIGKQAHWNVVGPNFRSVHLHLDELVALSRQYTDQVAERASAIGVPPDGRAATVAQNSGLPGVSDGWALDVDVIQAVTAVLTELIKRLRTRIDETDKADLVTQDLLIEVSRELEKQHWMWQAQQL